MISLDVMGIRMSTDDASPVLLLKERDGTRLLPIWIASVDAAAIALVLEGSEEFSRPLTHDLVVTLIRKIAGEAPSGQLRITGMEDGIFYAVLETGDEQFDVRPSDGVAVALRLGWSVTCSEELMDQVGVQSEESGGDEVERFREFLDSVNPDDFESDSGSSGS